MFAHCSARSWEVSAEFMHIFAALMRSLFCDVCAFLCRFSVARLVSDIVFEVIGLLRFYTQALEFFHLCGKQMSSL